MIDKYGTPASDSSGTANITYNIGPGNYKLSIYYNFCASPQISTSPLSFQAMLSMPIVGFYMANSGYKQGDSGRFWSSTYRSDTYLYNTYIIGTWVNLEDYNSQQYGFPVRCIAQN